MRFLLPSLLSVLSFAFIPLHAATLEDKPAGDAFAKFEPVKAPVYDSLLLKKDDRLAIIGDSITEQKMYSRYIETYITVCLPELQVTARQYGWSGETAEGFKKRMDNDCLRFKPTIATLCYGMNDHRYKPYDENVAAWYRDNYSTVAKKLKDAGARVVLGSPGPVGKMPHWVKTASGTVEDLNLNLCALRNIDIEIAQQLDIRFADVFWPMYTNFWAAKERYGQDYEVPGKDGVHPEPAGQLLMAYAFLKALGCPGDIGTITVDLSNNSATASDGHTIQSADVNGITIVSTRYPFCASGPLDKHNSMRSGMTLVPFNKELNRLIVKATNANAPSYSLTWGNESRTYTKEQLTSGVNIADDFHNNPFSDAFKKVDDAVLNKQKYETEQIKKRFHSKEAKDNMDKIVEETEAIRTPLAEAIKTTVVPVTHTISIKPVQ